MENKLWQGIGASPGRICGKTWNLPAAAESGQETDKQQAGIVDIPGELERLRKSVELTDQALAQYEEKVRAEQGEEFARIFAVHRLLLQDPALVGEMLQRIKDRAYTAAYAVKQVAAEMIDILQAIEDPYFKERAVDVKDVTQQLLQNLAGSNLAAETFFPEQGDWIVIADELTPAITVSLPPKRVLGFVVRQGGKTSHAAILARTYGIPAVVGVKAGWGELTALEAAELDGDEGWIRGVATSDLADLAAKAASFMTNIGDEDSPVDEKLAAFTLAANISSPADLSLVKRFHAQGVGLFRTEFLFMGDSLPSEEEQFTAYRQVIAECAPYLTVIRTLDIGGDKKAPALNLPPEKNPFLGVRALRLCLQKPELFTTQLRAVWRASAFGPAAVMFPMIAAVEELQQAKGLLLEAKEAVTREGHTVGQVQVGTMIEVPAAVWLASKLAKEVDFFSIGTNDLIQYTLAVDRENDALAYLYQSYHPAVLGMIAQVAQAANAAGIWAGICGEAAGDPLLAPFFAALGIRELSMAPGMLPRIRQKIRQSDFAALDSRTVIERVLNCLTAAEVADTLKAIF